MTLTIQQFCNGFERSVDKVKHLTRGFCEALGITGFGYVRVYPNQSVSWLTSNPDQDRFLLESGALNEDPLLNTPEALKEGSYLWFNDRKFVGCETFYRERARLFQVDHGLVIVKHKKDYLETCCFSGLLTKEPLYNVFMNEKNLFSSFMEHFTEELDHRLISNLSQGVALTDLKTIYGKPSLNNAYESLSDRASLAVACGWQNLLSLSRREQQCLLLLKKGYTYHEIGIELQLSHRTVEHYIESVKNKLGLQTRRELFLAAEKLFNLKLYS